MSFEEALEIHDKEQAEVKAEIRAAIKEGKAWTPLRPFKSHVERAGACRCGVCRKPSTHVSYCTGLAGRIAICAKHAADKAYQS